MASTACGPAPKLRIGVALPEVNRGGVELAALELAAGTGVGGVPVELVHRWGAEEPEAIIERAHRFAETEDLIAVVGFVRSSWALSAAAVYNQLRLPQIITVASSPALTDVGGWTYRLCLSDVLQGEELARYAVEEWGKRRIALLYSNDDYGRGLAYIFGREVDRHGAEVVSSLFHRDVPAASDQVLLRGFLEGLRDDARPDLLALFHRSTAAAVTLETMREVGLEVDLLGADALGVNAMLRLEPELTQGLRTSTFYLPGLEGEGDRGFVERFRARFDRDPEAIDAYSYDAVFLVLEALRLGGRSRQGVKSYLDRLVAEGRDVAGVTGVYRLAADHDARRALHIVRVRGGRFELLGAGRQTPWPGTIIEP